MFRYTKAKMDPIFFTYVVSIVTKRGCHALSGIPILPVVDNIIIFFLIFRLNNRNCNTIKSDDP